MQDVLLAHEDLKIGEIIEGLSDPTCGALVIFLGFVRNKENGETISSIRYDSYLEMAEKHIKNVVVAAKEKFGVRVLIRHRLGQVPVQAASLIVACAAPHRKEAFESAQFIIERIKQDIPIWKVEFEKAVAG